MNHQMIETIFAETLNQLHLSEPQKGVLRASLTLFSAKGFEKTTAHDIARMAGVSENIVPDKASLLAAVVTPMINHVVPESFDALLAEFQAKTAMSFTEVLTTIFQERLAFVDQNRLQLRVLYQEALNQPLIRAQLAEKRQQLFQNSTINELFTRYQVSGELVNWAGYDILRLILSVWLGAILPRIMTDQPNLNQQQVVLQVTTFLCHGLRPNCGDRR